MALTRVQLYICYANLYDCTLVTCNSMVYKIKLWWVPQLLFLYTALLLECGFLFHENVGYSWSSGQSLPVSHHTHNVLHSWLSRLSNSAHCHLSDVCSDRISWSLDRSDVYKSSGQLFCLSLIPLMMEAERFLEYWIVPSFWHGWLPKKASL